MAEHRAIAVVCETVLELLRSNYHFADFNNELEFEVYLARDFGNPMQAGVSLFLYRVVPDGTQRIPAGRLTPNGQRYASKLPLNLYFFLTAWAQDASLQHTIVGWMMRILEDQPILPATLLNAVETGVFAADESVELSLAELETEEMLHLWEVLVPNAYQLSIPYVARNVRIESRQVLPAGQPVQTRTYGYTA